MVLDKFERWNSKSKQASNRVVSCPAVRKGLSPAKNLSATGSQIAGIGCFELCTKLPWSDAWCQDWRWCQDQSTAAIYKGTTRARNNRWWLKDTRERERSSGILNPSIHPRMWYSTMLCVLCISRSQCLPSIQQSIVNDSIQYIPNPQFFNIGPIQYARRHTEHWI